jgi:hypothetical protein
MEHTVFFLKGVLAGSNGCRWALVTGHYAQEECFGFPVKPTAKQIREVKKSLRKKPCVILQKRTCP